MGFLAGVEGFEPSQKVLETFVLPLHHTPKSNENMLSFFLYFVKNTFAFLPHLALPSASRYNKGTL